MATATSRRAEPDKKQLQLRGKLCAELLGIYVKNKATFSRMEAIEAELKQIATDAGESFQELVTDTGTVKVSGAVTAEFKGDVPVVQSEFWLALNPGEKKKLEKSGLIKVEPQWGRASSGRVTVKVF